MIEMRRLLYILALFAAVSCFRDLGNYDYTDVNEVRIADTGFEKAYDVRRDYDVLEISPEITFTLDKEGKGEYAYKWEAVGQHFYRGERFTVGTERNLSCKVEIPAEEYILYLKVTDLSTDIVFSKSVPLDVRSTNTLGWILGGELPDGTGQVDMISISSNTMYLKGALDLQDGLELASVDVVWIDNDEYTSEDRLYVGTSGGAYKFDRANFAGNPFTSLKYSFAFPDEITSAVMTDSQKVSDKRHVIIVDGKAYEVSSDGGMVGSSFCIYDNVEEFSVADKMICNHTHPQGIRTFVFYDKDNHCFGYISGLTVKGMTRLNDAEGDQWSWDTTNDFGEGGLELLTVVNSFFSGGQSLALMNDPATSDKWIYNVTAPNSGTPVKNGRYKVDKSIAVDFDNATGYIMTTNHGYMIYAAGSALYGYNFRKEPQVCERLMEFDAPVTCIVADYFTADKSKDAFMVATYDDAQERSGVVYKFMVEDNPDRMAVSRMNKWDEGFLKVKSMCYKAF